MSDAEARDAGDPGDRNTLTHWGGYATMSNGASHLRTSFFAAQARLGLMPFGNSLVAIRPETRGSANRSTPRETAGSGTWAQRPRSVTCAGLGPPLAVS